MQGLNEDSNAIQTATGEKVGQFIHHLATFIGGIAIGAAPCPFVLCLHQLISKTPICYGPYPEHFVSCRAAFWKGWKLTLVMISVLPLLAACGLAFGTLMGRLSTKSSEAYGKANSIVQQASWRRCSESLGLLTRVL